MTEEKHACCIMVCGEGTYRQHGCRIKATVCRNHKWYCAKHDPEAVKARRDKSEAEWTRKQALVLKHFAAKSCAPDLLKAVKLVLALDGQPEVYPSGTYNLNDIPISWVVRLDPKAREQLEGAVKRYEDIMKKW